MIHVYIHTHTYIKYTYMTYTLCITEDQTAELRLALEDCAVEKALYTCTCTQPCFPYTTPKHTCDCKNSERLKRHVKTTRAN